MPRRSVANPYALVVGSRMRAWRDDMRLTLPEAADKLGCSAGHLGDIERGLVLMKIDFACRVARMYSVTLDILLCEPPKDSE